MLSTPDQGESFILHPCRYSHDVIYTYIGDILLACNPFKQLVIYSPKFQDVFLPSNARHDLMPHVYALSLVCACYHDLS